MDSVVIDYGLDPSGYMTGVGQVVAGNTSLQTSMASVTTSSTMLQRALSVITPSRAAAAGLAGFGAAAAASQASLHQLEATSAITGVSVTKLAGGIRQMARDMPLGNDGANALVSQFTKMGIASDGSESKILKLSKTTAQLSGATGEGPAALAEGLTSLSRVSGNTNLNPKRYEALADSLTSVSLKSGASATSILQLSKNIAPMANAAGIGATGVLGISSAFARLGEDGIGASTTVNKMLGDMNRSIRDGGPGIRAYATIVGKTADEFSRLYKANPTEAITQVTEALAGAGDAGPRQLEMIGLDGVRAQRQLQGVIATGGLRSGVAEAVSGYGSGATSKAAEAAYGGLTDTIDELTAAGSQAAAAFGAPLLTPMTLFTTGLTKATGLLVNVSSTKAGAGVMGTIGAVAATALIAKTVIGAAGMLGLGRQMATSGGIRALAAGFAGGRGDTGSKMERFGGRATELANSQVDKYGTGGQLGHMLNKDGSSVMTTDKAGNMVPKMRPTGGIERAMYFRGQGAGVGYGPVGPPGPSLLSKAATAVKAYGGNIVQTYAESTRQNLWNQSGGRGVNPEARRDSWVPSKGFSDAYAAAKATPGATFSPAGMKAFNSSLTGMNASSVTATKMLTALAKSAGQAAMMTQSVARTGVAGAAAGVKRAATSTAGLFGGAAGVTMMAGMGAYGLYTGTKKEKEEATKTYAESDINQTVNAYREQAGQATKAVVTVAAVGTAYAKTVVDSAKTMEEARTVTDDTMTAGETTESKIVTHYSGTPQQQAAQIAGMSVTGLTPNDVANVAVDLARDPKNSKAQVQAIIDALPTSAEAVQGGVPKTPTGSGAKNLGEQIAPVVNTGAGAHEYTNSWRDLGQNASSGDMDQLNAMAGPGTGPEWLKKFNSSIGGGMHVSRLQDEDKERLKGAMDTSSQRFSAQSRTFSPGYAKQEQVAGYESMLGAAAKSGDAESYLEMGKLISTAVTGKSQDLSPEMVKKFGGVENAMASQDKDYAAALKVQRAEAAAQPTGKYAPDEVQSVDSKAVALTAPLMSGFFDARGATTGSPQAASMASSLLPTDLGLLDTAVKTMTNSVGDSAAALADLKGQARAAASGLTPGTPDYEQAVEVEQRAGRKQELAEQEMTPSAIMSVRIPELQKLAANKENTALGIQSRREGEQGLVDAKTQVMAQMTARVQAQRAADIQKGIAQEDYDTQRAYAVTDYNKQVWRTQRDFDKQMYRAAEDYEKSVDRAKEDFGVARFRTLRDFNISIFQSEEDSHIARFRALRDFNISVKREIEDGAANMLDPYTRIQTKPTWDGANLLANLDEQNKAFAKQKENLDKARAGGLSQQSIDQLGLGKSENAQQLGNVVSDMGSDKGLAKQLNAAAKERGKDVAALVTDPSNVALRRSTEDLAKSLGDQEFELAKNLKRSRAAMNRSLADQAKDFAKNLSRGATDYRLSLNRNAADLATALGDMEYQQTTSLDRQETAFNLSMARIGRALLEADKSVGQDFEALSEAYNKAIHGTAVNWQKTMVTDAGRMVGVVKNTLLPALSKAWSDIGLPLPPPPKPANRSTGTTGSVIPGIITHGTAADGGKIGGYSPHPKADNIPTMLTAGEYVQPMSTVDYYGADAMEAIRTKKIPREAIRGYYDGGLINFGNDLVKRGFEVGEHPLFGGMNPKYHVANSKHLTGDALDINHDRKGGEMAALDSIVSAARAHDLRVLWRIAGHFDHMHVDASNGPDMIGPSVPHGIRSNSGSFADVGGGGGLTDKIIDAIMKKAPKGGLVYNHLLATAGEMLKATYGDAGTAEGVSAPGRTTSSANARLGQKMAADRYGWVGQQWSSLNKLWTKESGWNHLISNGGGNHPDNGRAFGIPQSLPGNKMASAGSDWRTNPATQIKWGLGYIDNRYHDPNAAWAHSVAHNWYDKGGVVPPGQSVVQNDTGLPEALLNPDQWNTVKELLTLEQGRALNASDGTHMTVIHNEQITNDYRNDFGDANITVMSNNPDDMADQLSRKAVAQRLTQTRGVAWSPMT